MKALIPRRALPLLLRCGMQRRLVVIAAVAAVASGAVLAIGAQWSLMLLIDGMASTSKARASVELLLAAFLTLIAAEHACWRVGGWIGARAVIEIGGDIRLFLFDHLTRQSARYFNTSAAGALASRIPGAADAVRSLLSTLIWNIVPPLADSLGAVVVIGSIDFRFAGALAAAGLVTCTTTLLLGRRGMPIHQALFAESARSAGDLVDIVANVSLLKAFGTRARERQRLAAGINAEAAVHLRSWHWVEATRALHDLMLWIITGGILLLAVREWRHGHLTTGSVVVLTTLTFRILAGSRELALSSLGLMQTYGAVAEALAVLAAPEDIVDQQGAENLVVRSGEVMFRDVTFSYIAGAPLLDRFSLHVPAGQHLGIVGASGAGKSTLMRLLQRQEEASNGQIFIDGQPIDAVTQQSLAQSIAVVTQEVMLFHRSIGENIKYARPEASMAEIERAAALAQCADFIRALPHGYDTLVGERGMALSGGQRQRIAIARAILKDARIIIFDEATCALDAKLERTVQLALDELTRGRTVLTVAHRLSTLSAFDRVVVLDSGHIVEDGPPAVLARRNGPFGKAWRLQTSLSCREGPDSEVDFMQTESDTCLPFARARRA